MKNIILYFLIATSFATCNNKENTTTATTTATNYDKTLLVNYYLRTDKSKFVTGEVYVNHQTDTTLPNIESATLEGQTMTQSKINGDRMWRMRIDKEFSEINDFQFLVNHVGYAPIEANFSIQPINSFKITEGVMSKSEGFTIVWDGADLSANNETLVILITDSKGQSASLNRLGETAASGLKIDPIQLQYYNFEPGPATVYLVRKSLIRLPQSNYYKQQAEIEYYTEELKINIVE